MGPGILMPRGRVEIGPLSTLRLDHVFPVSCSFREGHVFQIPFRHAVMENLGVGAPDALGEVEVPPVFNGGAARKAEGEDDREQEAWKGGGLHGNEFVQYHPHGFQRVKEIAPSPLLRED